MGRKENRMPKSDSPPGDVMLPRKRHAAGARERAKQFSFSETEQRTIEVQSGHECIWPILAAASSLALSFQCSDIGTQTDSWVADQSH
jgi:hypothetical protein